MLNHSERLHIQFEKSKEKSKSVNKKKTSILDEDLLKENWDIVNDGGMSSMDLLEKCANQLNDEHFFITLKGWIISILFI